MAQKKILLSTALISAMLLCGTVSCSDPTPEMGPVNFQVPSEGFNTSQDVNIKFYTTMGQDLQNVFQIYYILLLFRIDFPHNQDTIQKTLQSN